MDRKIGRIIQPDGVNYLIHSAHYSGQYAQEYVDMLIEKMEKYIDLKRAGGRVAPLMTLEQMEIQLGNMKKFEIVEE
jgi:hypothetical protein